MATVPPHSGSTAPAARLAVGTSGFAYDAWRGTFYPEKLPAKRFLEYYAQQFSTTEINATFYRFPRAPVVEGWARQVPDEFTFTLKMSQRVTHIRRLKDVDREIGWFCEGAHALGGKLGAVLVQLPPNLRRDAGLLEAFLAKYAPRLPLAFEFRHDSWFDDEIYDLLRRHRTSLAVVEMEEGDAVPRPRLVTGPFVYMRLRKGEYTDDELANWAAWMRLQATPVFCYLKHDELGPLVAGRLLEKLTQPGGSPPAP